MAIPPVCRAQAQASLPFGNVPLVVDDGKRKLYSLFEPDDTDQERIVAYFAIQDTDSIIYYLDNKACTIAAYRGSKQLWKTDYKTQGFTYQHRWVHGIWFDDKFIHLACGTCGGLVDKKTGRVDSHGCD